MNNTIYKCLLKEPDDITWVCDNCGIPNFASSFLESSLSITSFSNNNSFSLLSQESPGPPQATSSPKEPAHPKPHKRKPQNLPNLSTIVVNCQSIVGKKGLLLNLINSTKPDIVIGTESWLTPEIQSNEGYNIYRKDKKSDTKKKGGGVFIMISARYIRDQLTELDTDCELIWAQLQLPVSNI